MDNDLVELLKSGLSMFSNVAGGIRAQQAGDKRGLAQYGAGGASDLINVAQRIYNLSQQSMVRAPSGGNFRGALDLTGNWNFDDNGTKLPIKIVHHASGGSIKISVPRINDVHGSYRDFYGAVDLNNMLFAFGDNGKVDVIIQGQATHSVLDCLSIGDIQWPSLFQSIPGHNDKALHHVYLKRLR